MAKLNAKITRPKEFTHEGGIAARTTPEQQLRRSVLACFLWEDQFYEDGQEIAARIVSLVSKVKPEIVGELADEARNEFNLRHVPLLLLSALAKNKGLRWNYVENVIQRADELAELLAVHAKVNKTTPDKVKKTIPNQMKKGLAKAFVNFDEYQLGKYDRAGAIRLRDVLFLCHAKPNDEAQAALWARLVANELAIPDTWEVGLSGGKDKKETFTRLIEERKLGYLALLRNVRNMVSAGVDYDLIRQAIIARKGGADRVLPFRYVAAARACPQMEPDLDKALLASIGEAEPFSGTTAVLVDVSSSMDAKLSGKSDLKRVDAAATLASIIPGKRRVFSFSNNLVEVPPRLGMAGIDSIQHSQPHSGTRLFDAVAEVNKNLKHDRIIVITDEQAAGSGVNISWGGIQGHLNRMPDPVCNAAYIINVASYQNGVGYGKWTQIDGFSEGVLRYIREVERDLRSTPV